MIKGKRKTLEPEENLNNILEANAGLPAWRVKVKRPRRRVSIAYCWKDNDGKDVWAEFELHQRYYKDSEGQFKVGSIVTYHRQDKKPGGGFIADGKAYSIERRSGEIAKASYTFTPGKKISVPDDIVAAFREVWHINIDRNLASQSYDKWKKENLPQ